MHGAPAGVRSGYGLGEGIGGDGAGAGGECIAPDTQPATVFGTPTVENSAHLLPPHHDQLSQAAPAAAQLAQQADAEAHELYLGPRCADGFGRHVPFRNDEAGAQDSGVLWVLANNSRSTGASTRRPRSLAIATGARTALDGKQAAEVRSQKCIEERGFGLRIYS